MGCREWAALKPPTLWPELYIYMCVCNIPKAHLGSHESKRILPSDLVELWCWPAEDSQICDACAQFEVNGLICKVSSDPSVQNCHTKVETNICTLSSCLNPKPWHDLTLSYIRTHRTEVIESKLRIINATTPIRNNVT